MEHTPKGHFGRWKRPGPLLYKIPSPPNVTRVVSIDDVSNSVRNTDSIEVRSRFPRILEEIKTSPSPSRGKKIRNQEDPFTRSPRVLRATKSSPSPSRSAELSKPEADGKVTDCQSSPLNRLTEEHPEEMELL